MKFCVIGTNRAAISLLSELAGSTEFSLSACAVDGALLDAVANSGISLRLASSPEEAMLEPGVDVVVVALDDPEEILRLCRAASQAERHVVVIPPDSVSPAFSFELHLIFDESPRCIIPLTGRFRLAELNPESRELSLDPSQTLQLALELPASDALQATIRSAVQQGLDVLSASGFRYTQVTALESLAPDGSFLSRLITLNSHSSADRILPPATLTLKPAAMMGSQKTELRIIRSDGTTQSTSISESPEMLPRIACLSSNRAACSGWMESFSATLELAEAVEKSLRRRRTVDVHFDTGSERGVFKSQMTAIGCGVLMFMMLGMVAYLIVAQLVSLPDWVLHVARILWITPLMIFLIAQLLLPVARQRSPRED